MNTSRIIDPESAPGSPYRGLPRLSHKYSKNASTAAYHIGLIDPFFGPSKLFEAKRAHTAAPKRPQRIIWYLLATRVREGV